MFKINEDGLGLFEKEAETLRNEYEKELCNFSQYQLKCTDYLYSIMRNEVKNRLYGLVKDEILQWKKLGRFLKLDSDSLDIKLILKKITEASQPVLDYLEKFRKDLKSAYVKHCDCLIHVSDKNFDVLKRSENRVNMYNNRLENAVFAASLISEAYLYCCRVSGGNMYFIDNKNVIFSKNPFEGVCGDRAKLKKKVVVYYPLAKYFEPVIDYYEDNLHKYNLKFGHEWVSNKANISCKHNFVNDIPLRFINNYSLYYSKVNDHMLRAVLNKLKESENKISMLNNLSFDILGRFEVLKK